MTKIKIKRKRLVTAPLRAKLPLEERALLPAFVDVPEPPIYDKAAGEAAEFDEQQVARVELMMMKGFRAKRTLMAALEIKDGRAMDRYIARVHARWEVTGATQDFARHRGEALTRLDAVETELWSRVGNVDDKAAPTAALSYLNAILKVNEQRTSLLGLTPKLIAHLGVAGDGQGDFSRMVQQHERLAYVARRMHDLIEERSKVIEYDPKAA